MYWVLIIVVTYLIMCALCVLELLWFTQKGRNQIQERINDGAYVQGTLTNKGVFPKKGKLFKRYYGSIDNKKYHIGLSDFNQLEVGKVYYFILGERQNEDVIVKKDIKKYTHKVTFKEHSKDVYNQLKSQKDRK